MLLHSVECLLVKEAVVGNKTDDAGAIAKPVHSPAEKPYIRIVKFVLERGCRILRVSVANSLVNHFIRAISVVVVFIFLSHVIWRVANDDGNRSLLLSLDSGSIFNVHERKIALM